MTTTPPPRFSRALTPPTPLHGPMHDSPRRSSRIHSKVKHAHELASETPQTYRKRPIRPTSSQTLSPPSSPVAPLSRTRKLEKCDEDPLTAFPHSRRAQVDSGMLPTPSKTPRKRNHHPSGSTARLLFPPSRNTDIDELMPTPKKSRTGKKSLASTLDSFDADCNSQPSVEIYTDSKERVPEMNQNDDNPFMNKGSKAKAAARPKVAADTLTSKRTYGLGEEIDDAVNNNEGMIFTFRGRKIYRPFTELDELAGSEAEAEAEAAGEVDELQHDTADQRMLRHQAGPAAQRRMLRSEVKPRLLFAPAAEQGSVDDLAAEEAETDIEAPEMETGLAGQDEDEITAATPIKKREAYTPMTPPTTQHKKKTSPFDAWLRTKRKLTGKRAAPEATEAGGRAKRGRSAQPETESL